MGLSACGGQEVPDHAFLEPWLTCSTCSLTLHQVWASNPDDPNTLAEPIDYLENSGSVMTVAGDNRDAVVVYDRESGQSIRYSLTGQGPGEFPSIRNGILDATGDTLILAGRLRVSFLSPDTKEHYRTFDVAFDHRSRGTVEMEDGSLVLMGPSLTRPPMSIHHLSREGTLLAEFREWDSHEVWHSWHTLSPSADSGHVWLTRFASDRFVIEHWDVNAQELVAEFEHSPDWWVSRPYVASTVQEERNLMAAGAWPFQPPSILNHLHDDGQVVFIHIKQGEEDWEALPLDAPSNRIYNSMVVALDRNSGEPLAAHIVDDELGGFTNRGRMAVTEIRGRFDQELSVVLYEVRLERLRGQGEP